MLNSQITEIINREDICIFRTTDTIGDYLSSGKKGYCYAVDDKDVFAGMFSERSCLQFIGPMLSFMEKDLKDDFWNRLMHVPLASVLDRKCRIMNSCDSYADLIEAFGESKQDLFPVVNSEGELMGDVSSQSALACLASQDDRALFNPHKILQVV